MAKKPSPSAWRPPSPSETTSSQATAITVYIWRVEARSSKRLPSLWAAATGAQRGKVGRCIFTRRILGFMAAMELLELRFRWGLGLHLLRSITRRIQSHLPCMGMELLIRGSFMKL
uniref:Uncharacterized protein n=1 Tax=Opuntia streptacantha TaxID=393608 RepID=A0A7C8ZQ22_OPUST